MVNNNKIEALSPIVQQFWLGYLKMVADIERENARFYEAYNIGDSATSADEGAALIVSGVKTATSSLLWEYESTKQTPPANDELNIIVNGNNEPVCIVETIWLQIQPFKKVDETFAWDYGEWDRTLATWRERNWRYFSDQCKALNIEPSPSMPLVCERFKVIYST